ncbi:MAG: AmmeMemoRadiSam system radical SAM enzyme [Armatimonadetes bacterium CG_4_10_14_3_um_filter_66_18]|nr:AmmeMemoRadiSam system radical SAM enzyme [Armatimonadota bacterium]PIU90818.1 MAG: AmmeMemoRadiSam system radical SAM enzyme [Armatimonadetes bacterium CG06_land_8_20_14_3_00_66_21]PIW13175.1 MAG: AmmeMemoRadiSam system radical SAM enzyme [Armatimonadetes bacterium CG17_big_fil_post_rev_8_21_14_2_50_66_6]PIX50144.1 MAG: AmmeMemoRadiSam system radical SAM enzyme [Armatimonadetes bacterium CG_4_8_14_3_um_filter_66_20]PIY45257.1 MAG: AmmeMemoRadiSam system radical SAM enzyme [Armatimonadetes b
MTATAPDERASRQLGPLAPTDPSTHEAWFWRDIGGGEVECYLCYHAHVTSIKPGETCQCGARENRDGMLVTVDYGRLIACNVDEIEKRKLYHFHPGSLCLSFAAPGCNLHCRFCENWDLSQTCKTDGVAGVGQYLSPADAVRLAATHGCTSVAAAYTEPTIFFEYAYDTAVHTREAGLKSVWVTNGQARERPLRMIAPYLDAVSIDLKCFSESTYQYLCGGHLGPVQDNISLLKELGVHLEVSTPLILGVNDSENELSQLAAFLVSVDPDIPWHLVRFHPDFEMESPEITSSAALRHARETGLAAGLRYVYADMPGGAGANTRCAHCDCLLIERPGTVPLQNHLSGGACPDCGTPLPGGGLANGDVPPKSRPRV